MIVQAVRHLTAMQRKGGERTRAKLIGKMVRIWSREHSAWWRSGCSGYTVQIDAAGVYAFEEAWKATRHCGPEKQIVFEVVA